MAITDGWRAGVAAILIGTAGCVSTSGGEGLSLLRHAVDTRTIRVLIENLSPEAAAEVDPRRICGEPAETVGMWVDAIRLLDMEEALRAYSRCGQGVSLELIEATRLPLTTARLSRLERYIDEWKKVPVLPHTLPEMAGVPATGPDYYTADVLMALQADGTPGAVELCERLGAKVGGYLCPAGLLRERRVFHTPEDAETNDPYLALYTPRLAATSRDGLRRIYLLDTLKLPHDDTCRPVAVLKSNSGAWSLERVECETTSGLAEGL